MDEKILWCIYYGITISSTSCLPFTGFFFVVYALTFKATEYPPLVKELFNAVFLSCWNELHESLQEQLVRSLENVLNSESVPPEILQSLLNLAECKDIAIS